MAELMDRAIRVEKVVWNRVENVLGGVWRNGEGCPQGFDHSLTTRIPTAVVEGFLEYFQRLGWDYHISTGPIVSTSEIILITLFESL